MKKNNIITIAICLVLVGLGSWKYWAYTHPEQAKEQGLTNEITIGDKGSDNHSAPVAENAPSTSATPALDIRPATPINGTLKGVVEVGASGFNCFVANIDKEKNWELVTKEFGESLAYEGFMNTEDVVKQLKKYLGIIFDKGVAGRNAHFVMSSGALKNPKSKLIADAIQKMGFVVNRIDADQEGKYALKALLSKEFRDNSFTVDIGSGNTKISWYADGKITSKEGPGAKYYQNGKTDPDVYAEIKGIISNVPQQLRTHCFIIGGVPFKLAKESRNGEERFTALKNPDEYSAGDDVKYKSGLNIYRAIYETAGSQHYIFDWDANFTIGFLLTLN